MQYKKGDIYTEKCKIFLGFDTNGYSVIKDVTKTWKIVAVESNFILCTNGEETKMFKIY